jgi:hypothetical protein
MDRYWDIFIFIFSFNRRQVTPEIRMWRVADGLDRGDREPSQEKESEGSEDETDGGAGALQSPAKVISPDDRKSRRQHHHG